MQAPALVGQEKSAIYAKDVITKRVTTKAAILKTFVIANTHVYRKGAYFSLTVEWVTDCNLPVCS